MKKILPPIALLAVAAVASADLGTYTLTANASGVLNGTSFSNADVTLTGTGDTADIFSPETGTFALPVTATVSVAGVGSDSFTGSILVFVNGDTLDAGFTDGVADLVTLPNAAFATYDLSSSLVPVSGSAEFNLNNPYATTMGNFQVTGVGNATFEADVQPVPEPASMAALGLGGLALLRGRRK